MKSRRKHYALLIAAAMTLGGIGAPAQADIFGWARDAFKAANAAVAKYAENTANNARDAARNTAGAVARGDFDAAANEMVNLYVGWGAIGPFRDTLQDQVNAVAPEQVKKYTTIAANLHKQMEEGSAKYRAATYMSLYQTYKRDGLEAYRRMSTGDFDFSEYYRYSFLYAVATADWSNPKAIGASAERISHDQLVAYSWYASHKVGGAASGVAKNEVGLTDEAVEKGFRDLVVMLKDNPDMGAVGALVAVEYMKAAKTAQCKANSFYCSQPGQRICGSPSEQQTISVRNKTGAPLFVKVHLRANESQCENHVCDIGGTLQPEQSRMCVVFGKREEAKTQIYVQAWNPLGSATTFEPHPVQNEFPPIMPVDGGNPALQVTFNKAVGNSIDLVRKDNGRLCMDAGDLHPCSAMNVPQLRVGKWSEPPTKSAPPTWRDDHGQAICAARDRPGVGRAFQDGNGTWYCGFGFNDQEIYYNYLKTQFDFLHVDPGTVRWVGGAGDARSIRSPNGFPVCRANPGNGHMEFGWVNDNGGKTRSQCVLGWGGRSPSFDSFETLVPR